MSGKKPLLVFLSCFLISSLYAQNFTLTDTIKTLGKIQAIHLSAGENALYVLQSFVLTKYDLANVKSVKVLDIVRGGADVFSGSKYITQSQDSLFLKDAVQQTSEYIKFDKLQVANMSSDSRGETIVVSGGDLYNGIYGISKDRNIKRLPVPTDTTLSFINKLELSGNGRFLAIQTFNRDFETRDLIIFSMADGKIAGIIDHDLSYRFKFSKDNRHLVTLSVWGGIHIFNLLPVIAETGISFSESTSALPEGVSVDAFDFLNSDSLIITCSGNGLLSAWDARDGSKYHSQPLEFDYKVKTMHCSGKYTVVSFKDSVLAVYRSPSITARRKNVMAIEPVVQNNHFSRITSIIEDSVRNYIYTHTEDEIVPEGNELKIWDKSTLLQVKSIQGIGGKISFDGRYIVSQQKIFDTETLTEITPFLLSKKWSFRIIASDFTNNTLLVKEKDTLRQLNLFTTKEIRPVIAYTDMLKSGNKKTNAYAGSICFNRNKTIVATAINPGGGSLKPKITLHSFADGRLLKVMLPDSNTYTEALLFSPLENRLISYSRGKLYIWDIKTGDSLAVIEAKNKYELVEDIYSCTFTRDSKYLVIGYVFGRISFWDMQTLKKVKDYDLKKIVTAIHFINDNAALIASESQLFIYDFAQSTRIYELSNKVNIEKIKTILVDDKNDMLYTLTDNRASAWNFKSLLGFSRPDLSPALPRYLKDISFNRDSSLIICTDLFENPNIYDIRKDSAVSGTKQEVEPFHELQGQKSVSLRNGTIITAVEAGWGSSLGTFLIFNKYGGLVKNLWSQLRFDPSYNICLVPDHQEKLLYFTASIKSRNYILSMNLETYEVTEILARESSYTNYMYFINDSVLLIAGNDKLFLNVKTKKTWGLAQFSTAATAYYDPASRILFTANSYSIKFFKLEPFIYEFKTVPADDIEYISYSSKRKEIITGNDYGEIIIYDFNTLDKKMSILPLDTLGYALFTAEGYYYANKTIAPQMLAFRKENQTYVFDQFDQLLNRPDIIIRRFPAADSNETHALQKAFEKRLKKQNAGMPVATIDQPIEKLEIVNKNSLPSIVSNEAYRFFINTGSASMTGKTLVVTDNNVTILEQKIANAGSRNATMEVTITLGEGVNKIFVYTVGSDRRQSAIQQLRIVYTPLTQSPHKTWFVGIGIDHFVNAEYNLLYSVKDIRDLAKHFLARGAIIIDTLFDQRVTVANVAALKERLQKTGINDRVIIAYSGHGLLNDDYDYFLSTYSVNFNKPEQNGLPYDALEDLLKNCTARKKLLLIDACHSGEVDKEELVRINLVAGSMKLKKGLKPVKYKNDGSHLGLKNSFELMQSLFVNVGRTTGATIISAAAGTQFALERNDLENGVFTFSILEAMQKYPTLKISGLKKIVEERVGQLTNGLQKPTARNETIAVDWDVW